MKVLFLDIDGVLNSTNYFTKIHDKVSRGIQDESSTRQYASAMLDPDAIELLNRIVSETGAVIVISSTWRMAHPMVHIERMLEFRGFDGDIIGSTPDLPHDFRTPAFDEFLKKNPDHIDGTRRCRGNEIQAWLDAVRVVKSFAILDDDSDMGHLAPYLVHTSGETGLQASHVEQAIKLLGV